MRRVDCQRHQHREDAGREDLVEGVPIDLPEIGPGFDVDAGVVEFRLDELAEGESVASLQLMGTVLDHGKHFGRRRPDVGGNGKTGEDAALEPCDAHHEELVEIAREDREEVSPLEEREFRIFGEFEHPGVEGQPAQLAVQVAIGRQGTVVDPGGLVVVVIETVGGQSGVAKIRLVAHTFIIAPRLLPTSRAVLTRGKRLRCGRTEYPVSDR